MTKEPMPPWTEVPPSKHIYPYLLLELHELGGEAKTGDVVARLAERFQLSKKLLKKKMKGGDPHFRFNVGWARQELKKAGYLASDSPVGIWSLSREGREKIPNLTRWDTNKDKELLDNFREEVKVKVKLAANKKEEGKAKQVVEEPDKEDKQTKEEPVPPWTKIPPKKYIYPYLLLELHKSGGEARTRDAVAKLAEIFQLSEKLLKKKMKGGDLHFYFNAGWARLDLKDAGYLASDSPIGVWALSQKGREKIPDLAEWDTNKDKESLDNFREKVRLAAKKKGAEKAKQVVEELDKEKKQTKKEEQEQERQLNKIRTMDPFAFERLCKKLFKAVGYEDAVETKRTGDLGIDGFGFFAFGLVRFKVVFQSKRYQKGSNISSDRIQALHGAMVQDKAEKAVFITTSDFTKSGREAAHELGIECINGEELIELLKKHRLGYRPVEEPEFDEAFFDNT